MSKKYISIHAYCNKHKIPPQTVYLKIREGKLKKFTKIITKEVKRLVIEENAILDYVPRKEV